MNYKLTWINSSHIFYGSLLYFLRGQNHIFYNGSTHTTKHGSCKVPLNHSIKCRSLKEIY